MIKLFVFLTFLIFLVVPASKAAEPLRRALELELEDVEGAQGYEVQVVRFLKSGDKKAPVVFKLKGSVWNANLVPGRYEISVRSIDSRGVPGDWGKGQELLVKVPAPSIKFPASEEQVKTDEEKTKNIKFQWLKVDGAEKYKIKIYDGKGSIVAEKETSDEEYGVSLPVAQPYSWEVVALFDGNLEGDSTGRNTFEVIGAKLNQPSTHHVEDFNTTLLDWKGVDFAQKYSFQLEKKEESGQWSVVETKWNPKPLRKFQKPLPTGEYRIRVKAVAERRVESDEMYQEFKTTNLDRSPAAIEQIKSESSYETKGRMFAVLSYYAAIVNYSGKSLDTNKLVSYNAIGGTGRVGAGYWFKEGGPWGMDLIADMSGFSIGSQTFTYTAAQLDGVYRYRLGALGQLRLNFGAKYRELPVTVSDANDPTNFNQDRISTLGPQGGITLAHGLTRKIGLQVNASAMASMQKVKTPNNNDIKKEISYQAGVLGSLKLSDELIGYVGYAYKVDYGSYSLDPSAAASSGTSGFQSDDYNTVKIGGHFINFMLEYGF